MDMLDQYLEAVAAQLPRDTREDIIAELRDVLLTRFEAREDALGRPLTDDEREAILREMGHPLVVAARYRKGPQVLLGPELFPYWLFAVRVGVMILAAIAIFNLVIHGLAGGNPAMAFAQAVQDFISSVLIHIGAFTLIGALCEHFGWRPHYLDNWRVRDLKVFRFGDPSTWAETFGMRPDGDAPEGDRPDPRGSGGAGAMQGRRPTGAAFRRHGVRRGRWPGSSAMGSLTASVVFLLWWVGLITIPAAISFHGDERLTVLPTAIWAMLFVPILIYTIVHIVADGIGVAMPHAARLRAMVDIPVAAAGLVLVWMIAQAQQWAVLTSDHGVRGIVSGGIDKLDPTLFNDAAAHTDTVAGLASLFGILFSWMLLAVAVGLVLRILRSMWRVIAAA